MHSGKSLFKWSVTCSVLVFYSSAISDFIPLGSLSMEGIPFHQGADCLFPPFVCKVSATILSVKGHFPRNQ